MLAGRGEKSDNIRCRIQDITAWGVLISDTLEF